MIESTRVWIGWNSEEVELFNKKPTLSSNPNTCYACNHSSRGLVGEVIYELCDNKVTLELLPWAKNLAPTETVELEIRFVGKEEAIPAPKRVRKKKVTKKKSTR